MVILSILLLLSIFVCGVILLFVFNEYLKNRKNDKL